MTHLSPLRRSGMTGVVVGAEDMSSPSSDAITISCPQYATVMVPISPLHGSKTPIWSQRHCTIALRDLKVWLDGVWEVAPYELERVPRPNGDIESWWVAVIGPKTRK
jgi:hypothetical protein